MTSSKVSRPSADEKREVKEHADLQKALAASKIEREEYETKTSFSSLLDLIEKIEFIDLPADFSIIKRSDMVIFALMKTENAPYIVASIVIDSDLNLNVYIEKQKILKLTKDLPDKIYNLNDLGDIIKSLNSLLFPSDSPNYDFLIDIVKNFKIPDGMENVLKFICDQLQLLKFKSQTRKYNPDFLIWASLIYSISPHVYRFLLSTKNFILPHPSTLRRMTSKFNLNPKIEQNSLGFLAYIKSKFIFLNKNDHKVILMIDEIHLKPYFDYKGGTILGASHDTVNAATTAYVFMIQSLLSDYKDVVHILPVSKLTAENLFDFLKNIVIGLEKIGFMVICIVSDNNAINRKTMSFFATPPRLSIVYNHPVNPLRPPFFFY